MRLASWEEAHAFSFGKRVNGFGHDIRAGRCRAAGWSDGGFPASCAFDTPRSRMVAFRRDLHPVSRKSHRAVASASSSTLRGVPEQVRASTFLTNCGLTKLLSRPERAPRSSQPANIRWRVPAAEQQPLAGRALFALGVESVGAAQGPRGDQDGGEGRLLPGRHEGSHRQFKHASKTGRVTIAGYPGDDLAAGTYASILKQAGLKR